jgi:hypothetical protein
MNNYELIKESVEKRAAIPAMAMAAKKFGPQIASGMKSVNRRIAGGIKGAVKGGLAGAGVSQPTISRIGSVGRRVGSAVKSFNKATLGPFGR